MLKRLKLERFKSFEEAELELGPLTIIVGPNASGKSNIRDAFRFVHGISRGYSLAEIIGEKWGEGGVLQWRGIRGGLREASFNGNDSFAIEVTFDVQDRGQEREASYRIEVDVSTPHGAHVVAERLKVAGRGQYVFDSHPDSNAPSQGDSLHIAVRLRKETKAGYIGPQVSFVNTRPVLSQLIEHADVRLPSVRDLAKAASQALGSMRFLDLSPEAMRLPSIPGQVVLGDRGENLSSVLQLICQDANKEANLLQWVRELTPMDVVDFDFPMDQTGRVLATLVESGGRRTTAYSASDGTLRFLAMIAALLGPEAARFYFFEELENGLHPTRLSLLVQLIEQQVTRGSIQMVATTHSPQLLSFLSSDALSHTVESYRLDDGSESGLTRILDLPEADRVISDQGLARLHASGWLEDAIAFSAPEKDS